MTNAIWWLRRDLRLHDNSALQAALKSSSNILPVFILDPNLWQGKFFSPQRADFLLSNLQTLDQQLQKIGSHLVIRRGRPLEQLRNLIREFNAQTIFAETDFTPYACQRDAQIARQLPLKLVGGTLAIHPEEILKADGQPYQVYTPFMRRWKAHLAQSRFTTTPPPDHIRTQTNITSDLLPPLKNAANLHDFPSGETEALQRLEKFTLEKTAPIHDYAQTRDFPDLSGTSQLSPYLHLGIISPRLPIQRAIQTMHAANSTRQKDSAETWLNELIWREFYTYILYHFPSARKHAFHPQYREIPWQNDPNDFSAWITGATGYPLVDAGMRQLAFTGWMHNRLRMVTASFLVKNLLIDWQWGESWFMQNLLDGDIASNNGGWQWVAGTGTDAAPYFRIFNPISQSRKFDPDGAFIRKWVPELRNVPNKYIHTPWEMDTATQQQAHLRMGEDYPLPIIDLAFSRQRAIEAYQSSKNSIKK
ncbi:DNA photolyase family protein [bacterium]|nr:DNA photolyase family protein [bacterium]